MKNTALRFASLTMATGFLSVITAQAQFVLGSWQNSTSEGWINNANGMSITDPANTGVYSFVSGVVSGYSQSLQMNQSGFGSTLRLNLESQSGEVAAFLNNHLLSFTYSVDPASVIGTTSGYSQIYTFNINAQGYGFNNVGDGNNAASTWGSSAWSATGATDNNQNGMPNFYFYDGAPARSQTVTFDYSSILPLITTTPSSGYIQLTFTFNNGGGAPANFYMNNVMLSGGPVPEPTTIALLGMGALAGVFVRRRRNR